MKKRIIITLAIASAFAINNAWAQPSTFFGSVNEKGSLKHFLYNQWLNITQQPIPDLATIEAINTAKATVSFTKEEPTQQNEGFFGIGQTAGEKEETTQQSLPPFAAAMQTADHETSNNVVNSLTQFHYSMYKNTNDTAELKKIKTAEGKSFEDYANENSLTGLTGEQKKASDTLYIHNLDSKLKAEQDIEKFKSIKKPTDINNALFNFGSIITPVAYTTTQEKTAKDFVKYAAQSTQDLAAGVDFNVLHNNPAALKSLVADPIYEKYKLTIRTILSIRSMLINNLNQLIAERTPMQGLGTAAGLTANQKASPLQVEAYQANHRIEDTNWYTTIQNASPATLQRETLIVLAEIEHQNYQAHLDRERLLAAVTALGLQNNATTTNGVLMQEAPKVQQEINKYTGNKTA